MAMRLYIQSFDNGSHKHKDPYTKVRYVIVWSAILQKNIA